MDLLRVLTPEQMQSLSAEQLTALGNIKKNRMPKLKSLILSFTRDNSIEARCKMETKILRILCEYSEDTFYLLCTHYSDSKTKIHIIDFDPEVNTGKFYQSHYRLFTKDEIIKLVPENMIDKLFLCKTKGLSLHVVTRTTAEHFVNLTRKVNNLKILSTELLFAYAYFQPNFEVIYEFIKKL